MNAALVVSLLLRRLRSRPRQGLLLVLVVLDASQALLAGAAEPPDPGLAAFAALVVATGLLGREWSEGSLAVLLCRPVTRAGVVLAGWCAGTLGGFATWLLGVALRAAATATPGVAMELAPSGLAAAAGFALASAAGLSAAGLLFALAGRGPAGAGLHLALLFAVAGLLGWSSEQGPAWLEAGARFAAELLLPVLDPAALRGGGSAALQAALAWSSNVALLLALALWRLESAQLAYSSSE